MLVRRSVSSPGTVSGPGPRHGLARVLSKLGICSRAQAFHLVEEGRVQVNGRLARNPEAGTDPGRDRICVDGVPVVRANWIYLALNKPRGLITTRSDERGRPTVFECLRGVSLPAHVMPVGRLDQASEGLLLFTNDTHWAARLTDPASGVEKTYHLQVDRVPGESLCERMVAGCGEGKERLAAARARVLRAGERHGWLEVGLLEGRNRHLRRLCQALGMEVLRLVRVRIGGLTLGELAKGAHRHLTDDEVRCAGGLG